MEDENGNFDWGAPDEEVHTFVNDLERPVGTYLYGRRMYETMLYWETAHMVLELPPFVADFTEMWQAADKIVFSKSLTETSSSRTRIERDFDPDMVRQIKASTGRDITVGGSNLAGQAIRYGLVDELQLLVVPVIVGGGKKSLPDNEMGVGEWELLDEAIHEFNVSTTCPCRLEPASPFQGRGLPRRTRHLGTVGPCGIGVGRSRIQHREPLRQTGR